MQKIKQKSKIYEKEKDIYNSRITIEHSFGWHNNFPIICCQYEKTIEYI